MRLYTRTGATALDDAEYGHFEAEPDGGFELPDDLADRLHGFAVRGRPLWESDVERQHRLAEEELERRKDPATLLGVVEQLMKAAQAAGQQQGAAQDSPEVPPARRAPKRTPAK
jgi:hypothetical protein